MTVLQCDLPIKFCTLVVVIGNAVLTTQAFSPSTSTPSFYLGQYGQIHGNNNHLSSSHQDFTKITTTKRFMKRKNDEINLLRQTSFDNKEKNQDELPSGLSAASFSTDLDKNMELEAAITTVSNAVAEVIPDSLGKILGASFLVTSNTVGASMMVLPKLASGPGLMVSSTFMFGVYLVNLFSGILIAEVAINQYESSKRDVPSSFKEFSDVNFESKTAGSLIGVLSMFCNTCVLSFQLVCGGHLIAENQHFQSMLAPYVGNDLFLSPLAGHGASIFAALGMVALVATQNSEMLSKVASVCCMTLFISFAGLVLPGLASISNPVETIMAPGTSPLGSPTFFSSISTLVPVALMASIYQNIVPTVTKMLNYDRARVVSSITLGSFVPLLMYLAFCYTQIGSGGIETSLMSDMFMGGIRMSTLFGSSMACIISIAMELDLFLGTTKDSFSSENDSTESLDAMSDETQLSDQPDATSFNVLPVVLSVIPALLAGILFSEGEGFIGALRLSGSYGTPVLYGIIPVLLAFNQRKAMMRSQETTKDSNDDDDMKNLLSSFTIDNYKEKQIAPGGLLGLSVLGVGSILLMSNQFI
eukprot:CAMPEP_0203680808 /NCGR_PEP_ID=MMETSP0090-20130426/40665_1 /ASSEMBLY_ACC=CAM_ASM_001088 /TAXON_ID=426623 /ORGANISM="Chaetoceros affinis, Strain CCMP159" /LENGTH=586 /DNA_ID=CAMNT_0050549049 /DNA_START=13 /DNA_END=1770 /DNA_ORIENTATION=+